MQKSHGLYALLLKPRQADEDSRRREFILNVLLLGTLALSFAALLIVVAASVILGEAYEGASSVVVSLSTFLFLWLYMLSRSGMVRLAAYIFTTLYFLLGVYILFVWGILLPQGLLLLALVIVMTGVLIGTRGAFYMTVLASLALLGITYLHTSGLQPPDLTWMRVPGKYTDTVIFILTLSIITITSWLSNRETEKSLKRARRSEVALKRQRDLLEVRVEARTKQLQQVQMEKITEMYRFVELGRLSSNLLHDLASPLTAVALDLKELSTQERSQLLDRAVGGIKQIESFVRSARKQVQNQEEFKWFSAGSEISQVIKVLQARARDSRVAVVFSKTGGPWRLFGNHIKFHQAMLNLISNALDAYEDESLPKRQVTVILSRHKHSAKITVHNNGQPISQTNLPKVFEPFFTTKPSDRGTGIGLTIVKRIIEEDFAGSITVTSSRLQGTLFTIKLPLRPGYDEKTR